MPAYGCSAMTIVAVLATMVGSLALLLGSRLRTEGKSWWQLVLRAGAAAAVALLLSVAVLLTVPQTRALLGALVLRTQADADTGRVADEWLPALERFAPQMIFISAGFDGHRDDELAQLCLTEDDYAWVTQAVCGLATRHAQGRVVSVLEGGYDLPALARSVRAHLDVLLT